MAAAQATKIMNEAESYAKNLSISAQANAYTQVSALTGLTAQGKLMDYIYYSNLHNL